MKNLLIVLFSGLFVLMVYTTISTSLESNLFEEWDFLASIPWMNATLIDFYINTVVIFAWIAYRERNLTKNIVWLILLVCLGSMASTVYVVIQLVKLKNNEPVSNAFLISNNRGQQ